MAESTAATAVVAAQTLAVAGVFVSPRTALTALCCLRHASLFHVLLVWLSPQAGVLAWALETGVAARLPGVFMLMAMWLWPDALAALARSTASCGGEGINDEQQEQQQENAPPHIETLVAFVVALLAQRRRCARLRSALRRQKAAALGMPGSSISAATMTLEEQRNAAVRPVAAELALAERCHALLCAALEHSLALLARHAGVTGRTDNDENEDNEEEEEDALTPVAPRREAVAALLARHGPGGRVAAQMLADLVAAHDGTARHRHHRAPGGEMDDMSDDDDDDISDDEDGGSSGSLDVPASTIAQARAVLRCTAGTKKGTNTTSASSSSSSSTAGAQGTLAPPSSLPPMPPRSSSPASMLLLPSKFSGSTLFP